MDKNRIQGADEQGEQERDREAPGVKGEQRKSGGCVAVVERKYVCNVRVNLSAQAFFCNSSLISYGNQWFGDQGKFSLQTVSKKVNLSAFSNRIVCAKHG